jgi:hypothetical protein
MIKTKQSSGNYPQNPELSFRRLLASYKSKISFEDANGPITVLINRDQSARRQSS